MEITEFTVFKKEHLNKSTHILIHYSWSAESLSRFTHRDGNVSFACRKTEVKLYFTGKSKWILSLKTKKTFYGLWRRTSTFLQPRRRFKSLDVFWYLDQHFTSWNMKTGVWISLHLLVIIKDQKRRLEMIFVRIYSITFSFITSYSLERNSKLKHISTWKTDFNVDFPVGIQKRKTSSEDFLLKKIANKSRSLDLCLCFYVQWT